MVDEFDIEELESGLQAPVIPPPTTGAAGSDERYFELLSRAFGVCVDYKPKFGKGGRIGLTLEQFKQMYGDDPFYRWVGLDSTLMYAAHKAAGGMTSIYRQLGIGSQWILSAILQDTLGLTPEQATWTYQVPTSGGGVRSLSLDGRIELDDIENPEALARVENWLSDVKSKLIIHPKVAPEIRGIVIEARQGYKTLSGK